MSIQAFQSRHHPGELSRVAAYSRAVVRPVAACMLPVMIGTLVAVLEGLTVIPYSFWAAGAALALAWAWTSFSLRRRIAEFQIDGPWVRVRSVADVLADRSDRGGKVIDVRDYGTWAHVTVGLTSYELDGSHWPGFDRLLDALYQAQSAWQEMH